MKKLIVGLIMLVSTNAYASSVVIYDEITDRVIQHLPSANTSLYDARTDVVINQDLSSLSGVSLIYWKHQAGSIVEMSAGEKTQVDNDLAAALLVIRRGAAVNEPDSLEGEGIRTRGLIELTNKRDNFNTNRIIELQTIIQNIRDEIVNSAGGAQNTRDAVATVDMTKSATSTRTKADAVQDYKDDINAGNQDNP